MKTAGERLAHARQAAGFSSAREAAIALGVSVSTYNSHERAGQPGARTFKIDAARRYARRFGVSPAWLLIGDNAHAPPATAAEPARVIAAPVRGIAEASTWREYEDFDYDTIDPVPTLPGKWAHLEQFAYKVSGPSMDKAGILDGTFVVCVPYFQARAGTSDGDVVVVERRRGPAVERTVKRLKIVGGQFELWPESTHPRWQSPIVVTPNGAMHEGDGTTVEIVGLVIGRYAPM
jgi:SOS-response transcriptional repressor LexA